MDRNGCSIGTHILSYKPGLASQIVEASDAAARDAGAKLIKLHAQEYVLPLYVKAGYTQIAPVDYEDEGQPHVWMAKRVDGR